LAQTEIKIYPNPTKDFINLETTRNIDKIEWYDILGTHIFTKKNSAAGTTTFDIQNFESGGNFSKIQIGIR